MAIADLDIVISRMGDGIIDSATAPSTHSRGWPTSLTGSGDAPRSRSILPVPGNPSIRQSPQPAAVNAGDLTEVFALKFPRTDAEREQWLDRRTADFGDPFCS
jgi:hypothetical protein